MLLTRTTTTSPPTLITSLHRLSRKPSLSQPISLPTRPISLHTSPTMNFLSKLGFRSNPPTQITRAYPSDPSSSPALQPDLDTPRPGQQFAQFGAGCFWGVELAFQRVPGVSKTEVGYTQGVVHNPSYNDVCDGTTKHSEVVRVQYDPNECTFGNLLDVFWSRHDPTTPNRSGNDVGTQYRSGIYYYTSEQEKEALESMERQQKLLSQKIVTEILPAKMFYRAGGRLGRQQSAEKGCNDPIRCYG